MKVLTGMPAYNFNQKFAKPLEKRKQITIVRSKLSRIIPKNLKGKFLIAYFLSKSFNSFIIFK